MALEDDLKKGLKKHKNVRHVDIGKVVEEIDSLSEVAHNPASDESLVKRYHIHKVPVDKIEYLAADAIVLNRYAHQSGRGCYRHLFDKTSGDYAGLATEFDSGSYKKLF